MRAWVCMCECVVWVLPKRNQTQLTGYKVVVRGDMHLIPWVGNRIGGLHVESVERSSSDDGGSAHSCRMNE